MSFTPFSTANKRFSDAAHLCAKRDFYPHLFMVGGDCIAFEDTTGMEGERNRILDGEMAVDRVARVTYPDLSSPIVHSIQERFRKPKFQRYRDLTLTEQNHRSGLPGEIFKICSGWFTYAYYDDLADRLIEAVAVPVPSLLLAISSRRLPYTRGINPRSGQSFICILLRDLVKADLVVCHLHNGMVRVLDDPFEVAA